MPTTTRPDGEQVAAIAAMLPDADRHEFLRDLPEDRAALEHYLASWWYSAHALASPDWHAQVAAYDQAPDDPMTFGAWVATLA